MKKTLAILLLGLTAVFSLQSPAAFQEGYMSPQDIQRALNKKFFGILIFDKCALIKDEDRSLLGDINSASGDIANTAPGSSFLSWYNDCIATYNSTAFKGQWSSDQPKAKISNEKKVSDQLIPQIVGSALPALDVVANYPGWTRHMALQSVQFKSLSKSQQEDIIARSVRWILGSDEEILAYKRIQDVNTFRAELLAFALKLPDSNMAATLSAVFGTLLLRDEFLLY